MSHVLRASYEDTVKGTDDVQMATDMKQRKWATVNVAISDEDLSNYFAFLNDAVVLRSSREDVPLMTTTGIYGPIWPNTRVALTPGRGTGVLLEAEDYQGETLIQQLKRLADDTPQPNAKQSSTIKAKWVSSREGGAIPGLASSSNVFGATGSLFIGQTEVVLPVLEPYYDEYEEVLAFYGGRLLRPNESFCMGFDKVLFGVEYDTRLPGYIQDYVMQPFGGGGLFVEHHPFPHIFQPKPSGGDRVYCQSQITLGRESRDSTIAEPKFTFTVFSVPADGSAIAIKPGTIHNDSYTNGPQTVFVANTPADTVALRETSPFKNILLQNVE